MDAEQWFNTKFEKDLSDIKKESYAYYKYHVQNFVLNFFNSEKIAGKKILDLGCGPGFYSAIFAQFGANVVGIDNIDFFINKATECKDRLKLQNVKYICADFLSYSSNWNPCEFDYVIAIDTIVSFDHGKAMHDHEAVSKAFGNIRRILNDNGRIFIIECHPFFGRLNGEVASDAGEYYCFRPSNYKIEHKSAADPHHWFTLDEMTRATNENGLAILRIYEPEPSSKMKDENQREYEFYLRNPGMIVYEICKIVTTKGAFD